MIYYFFNFLNSNITNSNNTWGPSKNISKGDTSVTSLKNLNKEESIILENYEVDSIYEKNLKNVFLSEGLLKEDMIDEASESPRDYFPFQLAEVDMKSSKVKPAGKNLGIIDEK